MRVFFFPCPFHIGNLNFSAAVAGKDGKPGDVKEEGTVKPTPTGKFHT